MYPSVAKTFQRFLADHKVEETDVPLSQLATLPGTKEVVIAFDGNKILDVVTQTVREQDPVTVYTGSTPICVYEVISSYLELTSNLSTILTKAGREFRPMFVFNGSGFHSLTHNISTSPPVMDSRILTNEVFGSIATNGVAALDERVRKGCAERFKIVPDLEALIVRRFHASYRETFRAPYLAWSQISAFFADGNQCISEVYGTAELLAFPGVTRVVTKVDLERGTFDCIRKSAILAECRRRFPKFSEEDLSSLLLFESKNPLFAVPAAISCNIFEDFTKLPYDAELSRTERFLAPGRLRPDVQQVLRRNLCALDAPVMDASGKCPPLCDLLRLPRHGSVGTIFGRQLPTVMYYCAFVGAPCVEPFSILTQRILEEEWPLIDTPFYREFAERLLSLRVQTMYQYLDLVMDMNEFAGLRWNRHYLMTRNKNADQCLTYLTQPQSLFLENWNITPSQLVQNDGDVVYFSDIIQLCHCAVSKDVHSHTVSTTLTTILLKSIDLMGYCAHSRDTSVETSSGSTYCNALEQFDCPTLSEYGLLLIELVRTRTVTDDPIDMALPSNPNHRPRAPLPEGVRFAARAVSIIPINLENAWTGPFDAEMAAFGIATRMFGHALRTLTEVITGAMFMTKLTTLPLDQYDELLKRLPFQIPIEFNAGFLMTHVLVNTNCTLDSLRQTFPELTSLPEDLATLFWFWTMTCRALTVIISCEDPLEMLVEPRLILVSHERMSAACRRLLPETWTMFFAPLQAHVGILQDLCVRRAQALHAHALEVAAQMQMKAGNQRNGMGEMPAMAHGMHPQ